jgi:hypothetical protein
MVTASENRSAPGNGVGPVGGDSNGNGELRTAPETEVSETTTLLGASGDDGGSAPRKDSWVGFEDFEGLPWWKTPSVCYLTQLRLRDVALRFWCVFRVS